MTDIQSQLFALQDFAYRDFHSRLMPNIDKELIIGVRAPRLKNFTKDIIKSGNSEDFIKKLPHKYYEENNIHSFILCSMKDYGRLITELERFLPHIDNWATCDTTSPKIFKKHTDKLLTHILKWIKSDQCLSEEQYDRYFRNFNPDLYCPEQWAKMAKDAGMAQARRNRRVGALGSLPYPIRILGV